MRHEANFNSRCWKNVSRGPPSRVQVAVAHEAIHNSGYTMIIKRIRTSRSVAPVVPLLGCPPYFFRWYNILQPLTLKSPIRSLSRVSAASVKRTGGLVLGSDAVNQFSENLPKSVELGRVIHWFWIWHLMAIWVVHPNGLNKTFRWKISLNHSEICNINQYEAFLTRIVNHQPRSSP